MRPNYSSILSANASSRAAHISNSGEARGPTWWNTSVIVIGRLTSHARSMHCPMPPEWISHVLPTLTNLSFGHEKQAASKKGKLLDKECPSWLLIDLLYAFVEWICEDKCVHEDENKCNYGSSKHLTANETTSANVKAREHVVKIVEKECTLLKLLDCRWDIWVECIVIGFLLGLVVGI